MTLSNPLQDRVPFSERIIQRLPKPKVHKKSAHESTPSYPEYPGDTGKMINSLPSSRNQNTPLKQNLRQKSNGTSRNITDRNKLHSNRNTEIALPLLRNGLPMRIRATKRLQSIFQSGLDRSTIVMIQYRRVACIGDTSPVVVPEPLERALRCLAQDNERWWLAVGCFMAEFHEGGWEA